MLCLGIESTAHTFGVGVVTEKGEILADARDMFRPPQGWGIKPVEARRHHLEVKDAVLSQALAQAAAGLEDIDIIAYSQGAGLPPCLSVGWGVAQELAGRTGKPLIPVCHQIGHLEIAKLLAKATDPVILYVSGGNTQVIALAGGRYRVFGETQDIGIGNALDKFGRAVGMRFPCGPEIEKRAREGRYVDLPYVVKGMDLSFSGILTAALNLHRDGAAVNDLCFSLQETLFAMLAEVTERAMAHTGKEEALLTGGVAANKRLGQMLDIMARERGARFAACPLQYAGDNGVMIAWNGLQIARSGTVPPDAGVKPRLRTDDVEVAWMGS